MRDIDIFGLKTAGGSATAFPIPINVDDQVKVSSGETGIARTTNPTATSDGGVVNAAYDDLGRQIVVPIQVRDLIATAYASTATLAEVSLLAAAAGVFHDLISLTASNETAAAVVLDIRDVTAGNVVASLTVPASGSASMEFATPLPQGNVGNAWTIQNGGSGDISTTVVNVTALFAKNI